MTCLHLPYETLDPLPELDNLDLRAGDFFGTANPSPWLGKPISWAERFHSRDNQAIYTHSGIIINTEGDTIESLWRVETQNIWVAYAGKRILIARWNHLTDELWEETYLMLNEHIGISYPWWRLPLQLIPPLAKYLSFRSGKLVCSELVAKALYFMGARHRWYTGTNPDTLADEWVRWKGYSVIAEGVIV